MARQPEMRLEFGIETCIEKQTSGYKYNEAKQHKRYLV